MSTTSTPDGKPDTVMPHLGRAGGALEAPAPPAPAPTEDPTATLERSLKTRRPHAKASPGAIPSNRRRAS